MMWRLAKPSRSNASTMDYGCVAPKTCAMRSCSLLIANMVKKRVFALKSRAPAGAAGAEFVRRCFTEIEDAVNAANCYRGKILSFDGGANYRGRSRGLMVHKLPPVERANVILPDATLKLLDRNILNFVQHRAKLRQLGQSTRKGILLYGPPGTGKTHTIRYLASNLPGHTTLIITAAQVDLLGAYTNLARLLQPAMVVIEDVDLIATDREMMGPCEELMLNKLLNEMDGLKEDADILFVLTTNRPEQLEGALANRPGRVDQAIEIPLPDDDGRRKLVQLYGKGLRLDEALINEAVRRTRGVSAAFIKELMRRTAQAGIGRDGGMAIKSADLGEALDDMLFASGKLNIKLLGGMQQARRRRQPMGERLGPTCRSGARVAEQLTSAWNPAGSPGRPSAACRRSAPSARRNSRRRHRAAPRSFPRPSNSRSSPRRFLSLPPATSCRPSPAFRPMSRWTGRLRRSHSTLLRKSLPRCVSFSISKRLKNLAWWKTVRCCNSSALSCLL